MYYSELKKYFRKGEVVCEKLKENILIRIIPVVLNTALFITSMFSSAYANTPTKIGNLPIVLDSQGLKTPMTVD